MVCSLIAVSSVVSMIGVASGPCVCSALSANTHEPLGCLIIFAALFLVLAAELLDCFCSVGLFAVLACL